MRDTKNVDSEISTFPLFPFFPHKKKNQNPESAHIGNFRQQKHNFEVLPKKKTMNSINKDPFTGKRVRESSLIDLKRNVFLFPIKTLSDNLSISMSDVPLYLRAGELYRNLKYMNWNEEEEIIYIPADCMKLDDTILSHTNLIYLLKSLQNKVSEDVMFPLINIYTDFIHSDKIITTFEHWS